MKLLAGCLLLLACLSCAHQRSVPVPAATPDNTAPEDFSLVYDQRGSFSAYPAYVLSISADGRVVFEEKEFTRVHGKAEGRVSKEQLRDIISAIGEANFFNLSAKLSAPECENKATDATSHFWTISMRGRVQTINDTFGMVRCEPVKALRKMEDAVLSAVNIEQWIK